MRATRGLILLKRAWPLFFVLLPLVLAGCSSLISTTTQSSCDWSFVQSVGGIAVGKPVINSRGHVLLPVRCDVSGLQTVTVKPTAGSSGLVCDAPLVRVRARTVFITIRTALAGGHGLDARCPDADLGHVPAGEYSVVYLDPGGIQHPIGSIRVPSK